uniref:Uncharacterized protein n=1 Tax=Anguilla anguilla TaxID=7936 RepID=A0A0E9XQL0_ANGAN
MWDKDWMSQLSLGTLPFLLVLGMLTLAHLADAGGKNHQTGLFLCLM